MNNDYTVVFESILKDIEQIKTVFLTKDYDDQRDGWIVEDHIRSIEEAVRSVLNENS